MRTIHEEIRCDVCNKAVLLPGQGHPLPVGWIAINWRVTAVAKHGYITCGLGCAITQLSRMEQSTE